MSVKLSSSRCSKAVGEGALKAYKVPHAYATNHAAELASLVPAAAPLLQVPGMAPTRAWRAAVCSPASAGSSSISTSPWEVAPMAWARPTAARLRPKPPDRVTY